MRIMVIGATGGVGARLLPMLVKAGHEVHALHRKEDQARDLQRKGVTPHLGDLMEIDDFAPLVRSMEAVVFTAGASGSGPERTTRIDGDAPELIVRAMLAQGVGRLILVSVFPEAGRGGERSEGFEHYMAEKKRADVAVAASGLDWVLVRPGTLKDDDGNGHIAAGRVLPYGDVARGDVARTIAGVLDRPWLRQEAIELTDGGTEVGAALDAFRRAD